MRVIISLTQEEIDRLQRPIHGVGGFQSLLERLQARLRGSNLELTLEDVERIGRYVNEYGEGGFQGRLEGVLTELRRLANSLANLVQ